ncbi:MAG: hypothetical protein HRT68_09930 [Flavobacteriaceae bacterium]|nr:hypothetical protein [Flavobacteriaceae bacterium]
MDVFRNIDLVLARLGNMKAMKRTHVDTYIDGLIENIKSPKIGESKEGQLFIEL